MRNLSPESASIAAGSASITPPPTTQPHTPRTPNPKQYDKRTQQYSHQQPEVNYLPRFSPQLISLERYTLSVYRAGEIDLFENRNIVHIGLLVETLGVCTEELLRWPCSRMPATSEPDVISLSAADAMYSCWRFVVQGSVFGAWGLGF